MIVTMNYNGLRKIISGGQDGADRGGIEAAYSLGVATGGWAPKGWRTVSGSRPELANLGLQEHHSEGYPARTKLNVKESDGTIIIAMDPNSPGSRITLEFCKKFNKPYLIVAGEIKESMFAYILEWVKKYNIETLNIAGNRDYKPKGKNYSNAFAVVSYLIENVNKN